MHQNYGGWMCRRRLSSADGRSPELVLAEFLSILFHNGDSPMSKLLATTKSFVREEEGASLAEYGLLLALIAVVCMAATALIGTRISGLFNYIAGTL
jgi:pilus assembly protein Flp/PilA